MSLSNILKPLGITVIVVPKSVVLIDPRGTLTSSCTSIHISVRALKLGHSVTLCTGLYTQTNVLIKEAVIKLEGSDYEAWGEDDDYVVNKVLEALEMTRITE